MRIIKNTHTLLSLSILTLLIAPFALAQSKESKVKLKDLPAPVQQTVKEQSQGAIVRGLAKEVEDGQTVYELELNVAGHTKDMMIAADGKIILIEEQVELNALPQPVKDAILKQAGKGKIKLVESVTKNGTLAFYEAHVKKGIKTVEVKITPDGQLMK